MTLGKNLVFQDIAALAGSGDYRTFAACLTQALQEWGVLPAGTGYVEGKLIAETGKIAFDPDHASFSFQSGQCAYFSGAPEKTISLGKNVQVKAQNKRISLSLLPRGEGKSLLTAVGETGMDETTYSPVELFPGVPFTAAAFRGKLYVDTLEGSVTVKSPKAALTALDVYGNTLGKIPGNPVEGGVKFILDGTCSAVEFLLEEGLE